MGGRPLEFTKRDTDAPSEAGLCEVGRTARQLKRAVEILPDPMTRKEVNVDPVILAGTLEPRRCMNSADQLII
eukprot:Skav229813  [mRNA]  locus=scaffold567:374679:377557:- [translate_table: standard]